MKLLLTEHSALRRLGGTRGVVGHEPDHPDRQPHDLRDEQHCNKITK